MYDNKLVDIYTRPNGMISIAAKKAGYKQKGKSFIPGNINLFYNEKLKHEKMTHAEAMDTIGCSRATVVKMTKDPEKVLRGWRIEINEKA